MKRPAMAPKSSDSQPSVPGNGLPDKAVPYPAIPRNEAVAMNKRLSKMRKAGRTDLPEAYKKCHTQQEKRVFFIPSTSSTQRWPKEKSPRLRKTVRSTSLKWSQAGGPRSKLLRPKAFYQLVKISKALADASIAGLQERPHEDNNLGALGVKQYYYTKVKNKVLGEKKRKLTAEETVEDPELGDFNAMRDALHGGFQAKTIGGSKPGQEMALTAGTQQEVAKEEGQDSPQLSGG